MTTIGTNVPDTPSNTAEPDARADQPKHGRPVCGAKDALLLLWSTGIAAVVIGIAAFVLWGVTGVSTLFDMIVALCT